VDKASPRTAVAVAEGVDRLELSVDDRSLRDGRKIVAIDEGDEIVQEIWDSTLWGRDKRCVTRARTAPADPVLVLSNHAREAILGRPFEKRAVDVKQMRESEAPDRCANSHCAFHRADVAKDIAGGAVSRGGLIGGKGEPLVGRTNALDER
jgi:hypothetical protein